MQFIPADSAAGEKANKVFLRETEKLKYRPGSIVKRMKAEGFTKFNMQHHTDLWKEKDAKDPKKQLGVQVEKDWYWYEPWVEEVRKHCQANEALYKLITPSPKPNTPAAGPQPVPVRA